jgi:hypothetical protein
VRKGEAGVTGGERDAGADGGAAGPEAVDQRARERRDGDRHAGDRSDDQSGHAQAEPARVVEVDELERQDLAVAEHVQEDPSLHEPQLAREAKPQTSRQPPSLSYVIVH